MRILLVEDNEQISALMAERLALRGIDADCAFDLENAESFLAVGQFDAIILDLGLPDGDGNAWLKKLPKDRPPVLILSARSTLQDRVIGLDNGADDYLVKPADIEEIAARLRALLRRPGTREPVIYKSGNLTLNPQTREVIIGESVLSLSPKEFDFLSIVLRKSGQVVAREVLEGLLYSSTDPVTPNALEAIASRLRRRLSKAGEDNILHTVRGVGYYIGPQREL